MTGRYLASLAWTGDALFVYGGNEVLDGPGTPRILGDAYLVDPATGDSTSVETPPFEYPLEPGSNVTATVGDTVVLIGVLCAERLEDETDGCEPGTLVAAEFSLPDQTWRELELPDGLAGSVNVVSELLGVTSDGQVVFAVREGGHREPTDAPYWSYNVAGRDWSHLPGSGVRAEDDCFADDRLVVLTGSRVNGGSVVALPTEGSGSGILNDLELRYLDYRELSEGWQATLATSGPVYDIAELACGGGFAMIHDGAGQEVLVTQVSPDARWDEAPSAPAPHVFTESIWTGEDLLLLDRFNGFAAKYNPADNSWEAESPTSGDAIWTGDQLLVLSDEPGVGMTVVDLDP